MLKDLFLSLEMKHPRSPECYQKFFQIMYHFLNMSVPEIEIGPLDGIFFLKTFRIYQSKHKKLVKSNKFGPPQDSSQMLTFNFYHSLCNEVPTFFKNAIN